jgi:hypothetical protein
MLSLFINNGIYAFSCLTCFVLMLVHLWRYNQPGILVFAFIMQWVQVMAYVLWMNILGYDINRYSDNAGNAVVLSCIGLWIMSIVISLMTNKLPKPDIEQLKLQAMQINERKILLLYIITTLFLSSIGFVFGIASGVAQFLLTISSLKWVFFMMYGYLVIIKKKNKWLFYLIIGYEFASSLYSFFSSFKEVIFFSLIIALTFIASIKLKQILYGLLAVFSLLVIMLTWTAIKGGYREFLNKGTRQQVITVERSQAINKMSDQINNLSWRKYEQAIFVALYRIQYIYNFALSMDRVPSKIPYQNGEVWADNIGFVITPRFLFPDKKIYNASEKANKFTGKNYAGLKEGSSFSLGYFADSYVDFGPIGMFIPLLFIAIFVGFIYRVFYKMYSLNALLRFAIINVCLYNFISFEADGLFLFGRLLTTFLVYLVLAKTVLPSLQKWMYKND